jgi:transcriptional regulator with XRE-family HTH domain
MYTINKIPSDILKETASRHRALRKQLKMSQEELANRSGVSLGSIKRFEQTGKVSFESLLKLVHVLGRLEDFDLILKPKDKFDKIEKLFSDKTRRS